MCYLAVNLPKYTAIEKSNQPAVFMMCSPTIKLLGRHRQNAQSATNRDAHLQEVLKHVLMTGGAGHGCKGKSMSHGPKANNGT